MSRLVGIALVSLALSACSHMQDNSADNHQAYCSELKHQIMFNGATSNNTQATQQRAQLETLNRNYRDHGCE
jgi:hypothetical protein